jgi:hypothetical protein
VAQPQAIRAASPVVAEMARRNQADTWRWSIVIVLVAFVLCAVAIPRVERGSIATMKIVVVNAIARENALDRQMARARERRLHKTPDPAVQAALTQALAKNAAILARAGKPESGVPKKLVVVGAGDRSFDGVYCLQGKGADDQWWWSKDYNHRVYHVAPLYLAWSPGQGGAPAYAGPANMPVSATVASWSAIGAAGPAPIVLTVEQARRAGIDVERLASRQKEVEHSYD